MLRKFISLCLVLCLVTLNTPGLCLAEEADNWPEITHKGIDSWPSKKRMTIEAEVESASDIDLVRIYFKTPEMSNFVFVPMATSDNEEFVAVLPAAAETENKLEYLFLVKTAEGVVIKSQIFPVDIIGTAENENDDDNEKIVVYTEVEESIHNIKGFSDDIAVDVAESAAKFGVVAGLYSAEAIGGSTGTTGNAVYGGTVVASSGGVSTTVIAIGAIAAVAGGVAIAAGGGGSSSSSSGNSKYGTTISGTATVDRTILNASGVGASLTCAYSESGGQFTCSMTNASGQYSEAKGTYTSETTATVEITEDWGDEYTGQNTRYYNSSTAVIDGNHIDIAAYTFSLSSGATITEKWDIYKP